MTLQCVYEMKCSTNERTAKKEHSSVSMNSCKWIGGNKEHCVWTKQCARLLICVAHTFYHYYYHYTLCAFHHNFGVHCAIKGAKKDNMTRSKMARIFVLRSITAIDTMKHNKNVYSHRIFVFNVQNSPHIFTKSRVLNRYNMFNAFAIIRTHTHISIYLYFPVVSDQKTTRIFFVPNFYSRATCLRIDGRIRVYDKYLYISLIKFEYQSRWQNMQIDATQTESRICRHRRRRKLGNKNMYSMCWLMYTHTHTMHIWER